ncbi:glutamate-cysteine ligase family protein [Paractinoplanes toevensis]|uniref:Glutamate--cysteine ligase EgtA n=1 Tax=Paractinoplanes toevensis TaxID=571911 RepID=A0A919WAR7_9ACTN|nr:glutamate-cysteine ligase family protein [Actinoplanes toevensis]GIM96791.1 glutamate--cysteine ligase EgtA [Actinoplanes toevensis]
MTQLTEQAAELLIADRAFAPAPPGFVGAAVDVPALTPPEARTRLRHGYLAARSVRTAVVSGPPSPGLTNCLARMAEDLELARPMIAATGTPVADGPGRPDLGGSATDGPEILHLDGSATDGFGILGPGGSATDRSGIPRLGGSVAGGLSGPEVAGGGIRVALEAGLEGGGPLGLAHRWRLAHTLAPVLAAAFANTPGGGWRSVRQAARRHLPVVPPGAPREAWIAYAMDAPDPHGRSLRTRFREGSAPPAAELTRHLESLRPPVAARGHLEIDVADHQPGDGWPVPIAIVATLLDDPQAALDATAATAHLAAESELWERAAREALTDPVLAAAARDCFIAAYAALARQGAPRPLRDAVADFTERYVLRGRTPADDILDRTAAQA